MTLAIDGQNRLARAIHLEMGLCLFLGNLPLSVSQVEIIRLHSFSFFLYSSSHLLT